MHEQLTNVSVPSYTKRFFLFLLPYDIIIVLVGSRQQENYLMVMAWNLDDDTLLGFSEITGLFVRDGLQPKITIQAFLALFDLFSTQEILIRIDDDITPTT
ncbi:hypothetical protein ACJX0J_018317 [Zea mays]